MIGGARVSWPPLPPPSMAWVQGFVAPTPSMTWVSTVGLVSSLVFALSRSFSLWGGGGWVGRMP